MKIYKFIRPKWFSLIKCSIAYLFLFIFSQSCSDKGDGFLTELPFEDLIIVTSSNGSHRGVSAYDLDGKLIKVITNFRVNGGTPRSTIHLGGGVLLTVQDGPDKADSYDFKTATKQLFIGTNYFSGAIYGAAQDSRGNIYVAESNNIEKFDSSGAREPFQTGGAFIQGSVGACNISQSRRLFITDNDVLLIASYGNGNIVAIDVSTDTPICLSSVSVGSQVNGVLLHSNGSLYFSRLSTDEIYRAAPDGSGATIIWAGDTTRINNPTDLEELPDGNILVASSGNHQIWKLDPNGNPVGTNPFIADGQTLTVRDLTVILEEEQ